MVGVPTCDEICRKVRERTDTVALSFSNGKDSLAAWLILRKHFRRIIPIYQFLVPDLEFIEQSLTYYEKFFGERIRRVPNCWLWYYLQNRQWMTPTQIQDMDGWEFEQFSLDSIIESVLHDEGLDEIPIAHGIRAADSLGRLMTIIKHGVFYGRKFYPIAAMRKAELIELVRESGCKLPVDYRMFGRSFDAPRGWFLPALREYYPRDYARILEWFPLLAVEERRWI
jgi:hypothetical protein